MKSATTLNHDGMLKYNSIVPCTGEAGLKKFIIFPSTLGLTFSNGKVNWFYLSGVLQVESFFQVQITDNV